MNVNIQDWINNLVGSQIPGGCESCDAFQTFAAHSPSVTILSVHHDAWCPEQKRREGRT